MARSTLDVILNFKEQGNRRALANLGKMVATMGALTAAATAFHKAWDLAEQGAQLQKFEKAARNMAKSVGQDMDSIVDSLQDVSDGAIDQATAMELASRAIRLGVAETPAQFAELGEAAIKLGAAMGRGPVDAMNDIVTGIGRMSPLILDNIGIMTNGGQVFEDYADSIGKAAEELTDAEKKQALFNAAVDDAAPLAGVSATGFEQFRATTKDLSDVIKKDLVAVLEPLAIILADQAREALGDAEAMDQLERAMDANILTQDELQRLAVLRRQGLLDEQEAILLLEGAWRRWNLAQDGAGSRHEEIMLGMGNITSEAQDAALAIEDLAGAGDVEPELGAFDKIIDKLTSIQNKALLAAAAQKDVVYGSAPGSAAAEAASGQAGAAKFAGLFGGPGGQHGFSMTVPPGFGGDMFPFRASSGEQVTVSNRDERSFFSNSNVNINNGTGLEAFEEILRSIQ